ncbi:putative hAT dimerization domain, ribonuclease H-like superfamily protein [Tanacetum coccineum]
MHGNSTEMPYDVSEKRGNGETRGNAGETSLRKEETFLNMWMTSNPGTSSSESSSVRRQTPIPKALVIGIMILEFSKEQEQNKGKFYSRVRSSIVSARSWRERVCEEEGNCFLLRMTSNPGTSSSESISSSQTTNKAPLWDYVTRVSKAVEKGGTWKFTCNFCQETKQGSYSRLPKDIPLPCRGSDFENPLKKRKASSSPLVRAFDVDTRTQLDQEIARMFFTGGLPFNLARNPYYLRAFTFAANQNLGGYVPPGYNKLRTTLLQQEKANVERLLKPIKETWREKGVTIVTDRWSDPQRRPIINFMATFENGPMFIKAVNCMGEFKSKEFIANLRKEIIDDIGHQNVVQIITDNAANCKGTGEIIKRLYPEIYWTPCVVHTLNLALKNICAAKNTESNFEVYDECHWITKVYGDAMHVKNFIMNHTMRLSMYNRFSSLKLLSVADTRFGSTIVMLKRFKLIRRALETMVMSEEWASYREDDQEKARFVRDKVLNEPCLHLVYEMWDFMVEKVKVEIYKHEGKSPEMSSSFYNVVYDILVARWTKSSTPLQCLAHSLNPRCYSDDWLSEDFARVPPHKDGEISHERLKCFRRIYPNDDDYDKVLDEFADFSLKEWPFSDVHSLFKRGTTDAKRWWANFGAKTPLLQSLAFRVLGQPTSSSCCKRNWSTYSFIHSLRRNKLSPKRAEDLVFIHNNLCLLSRSTDQYNEEKTMMWDVGGDDFGTLEDTGFLEFASLSLDEPELESFFLRGYDNYLMFFYLSFFWEYNLMFKCF